VTVLGTSLTARSAALSQLLVTDHAAAEHNALGGDGINLVVAQLPDPLADERRTFANQSRQ
jgi:hypothetical protein